jgi:hypothetical protein
MLLIGVDRAVSESGISLRETWFAIALAEKDQVSRCGAITG